MTDLVPTEDQKINWSISAALREGRLDDARELLLRHPEKRQDMGLMYRWCFSNAQNGRLPTVAFLLTEYGLDINHEEPINKTESDTILQQAVHSGNHELVEWLLKNGANPNVGRPIIGAINIRNRGSEADAVTMIRLLVEYGCDLNRHYPLMGDENDTFTALDWAGNNTLAFEVLRSFGAKSTDELPKLPRIVPIKRTGKLAAFFGSSLKTVFGWFTKAAPTSESFQKSDSDVTAFFSRTFGPVARQCLTEIVPDLPTVKIRVIEPTAKRRCLTLFTDGMSAVPLKTTKPDTGYELAELFIELPPDWPYRKLSNEEFNWPIRWLRWASRFPHQNAQSLGGPVLIVDANEAVAMAPKHRFSAMLLLAETKFIRSDGRTIHLYRLFPLYPEEVALARNKDVAALFRAFDLKGAKFVIDMDRASAVPRL